MLRFGIINQRLVYESPDFEQTRDGNVLLLWREIPFWIIVDAEMKSFLDRLKDGAVPNEVLKALPDGASAKPAVTETLKTLKKRRIIRPASKIVTLQNIAIDESDEIIRPRPIENISINPTRRCNLHCAFCYNREQVPTGSSDELSTESICGFIALVKPFASKESSVAFLGGEPLLLPDVVLDSAEFAARSGFIIMLSTNGQLIDKTIARRAADIGLQVQVSLDGHTPDRHDRMRGRGTFEKAIRGIRLLVDSGVHTILSLIVHSENLDDIEPYYQFAKSLGVNEARFLPLKLVGGGQNCSVRPPNMNRLFRRGFDIFKSNPDALALAGRDACSIQGTVCRRSEHRLSCGAGRQAIVLDADGALYPCLNLCGSEHCFGNIHQPGFNFKTAWQSSPSLQKVRLDTSVAGMDDRCRVCPVKHYCLSGCHAETYAQTGRLNGRAYNCGELKASIFETLWTIGLEPNVLRETGRLTIE